jgi:hypothetical protein
MDDHDTHPPSNQRLRFLSLFQDLKCPGFLDLRTSDIPSVDIPMPRLNPMHLLSDPMADEISE